MGCCYGSSAVGDAEPSRRKRRGAPVQPVVLDRPPSPRDSDADIAVVVTPIVVQPQVQPLLLPIVVTPQLPDQSLLLDSVDRLPPVYYVIVGCGPAAVINHATLRASPQGMARINGLPVMHIGFANPWRGYMQHGMGQPPHLLSLPGFDRSNQPPRNGAAVDGGLDSKHFAAQVDAEFSRLQKLPGVVVKRAWVACIQPLGDNSDAAVADIGKELWSGNAKAAVEKACAERHANFKPEDVPYRLVLFDPVTNEAELVYAAYVDLCTGPGRPLVGELKPSESEAYAHARTPPWLAPDVWNDVGAAALANRRVLNGVDAIRDEVPWGRHERVCVTAGNGVGLNGAERARNNDAKLDWFARQNLRGTFANPRNRTFLWNLKEGRKRLPSEPLLDDRSDDDVLPTAWNLRYGQGAQLQAVDADHAKVTVTLEASTSPPCEIRDFGGNKTTVDGGAWQVSPAYSEQNRGQMHSKLYDRLVVPNGQQAQGLGQAHWLLQKAKIAVVALKVSDSDRRMLALEDGIRRLRVLGAAAQTYPGFALPLNSTAAIRKDKTDPANLMWDYRDTLPVSAVVDGFILSGMNIATANGCLGADSDCSNVNILSTEQITALIDARIHDPDRAALMARNVVAARCNSNGYADIGTLRDRSGEPDLPDCFSYGY